VRGTVELEVEKYSLLNYQPHLVEYILQWETLNNYGLPLCFNLINDTDLGDLVHE